MPSGGEAQPHLQAGQRRERSGCGVLSAGARRSSQAPGQRSSRPQHTPSPPPTIKLQVSTPHPPSTWLVPVGVRASAGAGTGRPGAIRPRGARRPQQAAGSCIRSFSPLAGAPHRCAAGAFHAQTCSTLSSEGGPCAHPEVWAANAVAQRAGVRLGPWLQPSCITAGRHATLLQPPAARLPQAPPGLPATAVRQEGRQRRAPCVACGPATHAVPAATSDAALLSQGGPV